MKRKAISLSLVLLFVVTLLSACGGVDDKVVGKWEDEMLGMITFDFTSDGKVTIESLDEEVTGTFKTSGKSLTIKTDDNKQKFTYSVSEDTLFLTAEGEKQAFSRVE